LQSLRPEGPDEQGRGGGKLQASPPVEGKYWGWLEIPQVMVFRRRKKRSEDCWGIWREARVEAQSRKHRVKGEGIIIMA